MLFTIFSSEKMPTNSSGRRWLTPQWATQMYCPWSTTDPSKQANSIFKASSQPMLQLASPSLKTLMIISISSGTLRDISMSLSSKNTSIVTKVMLTITSSHSWTQRSSCTPSHSRLYIISSFFTLFSMSLRLLLTSTWRNSFLTRELNLLRCKNSQLRFWKTRVGKSLISARKSLRIGPMIRESAISLDGWKKLSKDKLKRVLFQPFLSNTFDNSDDVNQYFFL